MTSVTEFGFSRSEVAASVVDTVDLVSSVHSTSRSVVLQFPRNVTTKKELGVVDELTDTQGVKFTFPQGSSLLSVTVLESAPLDAALKIILGKSYRCDSQSSDDRKHYAQSLVSAEHPLTGSLLNAHHCVTLHNVSLHKEDADALVRSIHLEEDGVIPSYESLSESDSVGEPRAFSLVGSVVEGQLQRDSLHVHVTYCA